jgi:hypothetical protein
MNDLQISGGAVSGPVRVWLRAEGFAVLALALLLYWFSGSSWWIFFALFLAPDLIMLFYLINPIGRCFLQCRPQLSPAVRLDGTRRFPACNRNVRVPLHLDGTHWPGPVSGIWSEISSGLRNDPPWRSGG